MFLEPAINDLNFEKDCTNLDWIKTLEILRHSFLNIHPNIIEEVKKHLNCGTIEQNLIINAGRGVLTSTYISHLFTYAEIANKNTIFIVSTFNKVKFWANTAKQLLNLSDNDVNINFGADPKCDVGKYTRKPIPGCKVYITDINGINRIISGDFFSGKLFGNKIDLMIIDKFFQTLPMLPIMLSKEIYPITLVDDIYFSKSNYDSLDPYKFLAWNNNQIEVLEQINEVFTDGDVSTSVKILKEVGFILSEQ